MASELHPEDVVTNFYKVLKIHRVKYSVYQSSKPEDRDQSLLEAELHLRKQYQRGLFYQAGRVLWTFSINDDNPPQPLEKFNLTLKETNEYLPTSLNRGQGGDNEKQNSTNLKQLSLLNTILLNSIKRSLLINLSMNNYVTPFGNASLINSVNITNGIIASEFLFVDPQISYAGDLLLSIATKSSNLVSLLNYISSPRITANSLKNITNSNIALYLAPSGIRAYFANETLIDSLTATPSNNQNLLIMLHLLIGIVFNKKLNEIRWVKLVPDLKHLNGSTPSIAEYLKPVQSQKFVIWPLDLCYIQNGAFPPSSSNESNSAEFFDSFMEMNNLLGELNKMRNEQAFQQQQQQQQQQQMQRHAENQKREVKKENSKVKTVNTEKQINEETDKEPEKETEKESQKEAQSEPKEESAIEDVEMDESAGKDGAASNWNDLDEELFGENNEITESDFNFFDDDVENKGNPDVDRGAEFDDNPGDTEKTSGVEVEIKDGAQDPKKPAYSAATVGESHGVVEEFPPNEDTVMSDAAGSGSEKNLSDKTSFDIPKHEMCLPQSPYEDPGAPLPMSMTPKPMSQSIFSPLKFNPVIRDVVDNKYGKGGKFYVPDNKETTEKESDTNSAKANEYSIIVPSSDEDLTSDSESASDSVSEYEADESDEELQNTLKMSNSPASEKEMSRGSEIGALYDMGSKIESTINFQNIRTPDLPASRMFSNDKRTPKPETESSAESPVLKVPKKPGNVRYHDSSNWIPFLTKCIPVSTIPEKFFYTNPSVTESELSGMLPLFTNLVAFNGFAIHDSVITGMGLKEEPFKSLSDYSIFASLEKKENSVSQQKSVKELEDFESYFDDVCENLGENGETDLDNTKNVCKPIEDNSFKNIENALKKLFSSVSKVQLWEYVGIDESSEEELMIENTEFVDNKEATSKSSEFVKQVNEHFFRIKQPKCKVKRSNQKIDISFTALRLWKVLSLSPLHETKNLRVLFVINDTGNGEFVQVAKQFLMTLMKNYESCGLGSVKFFEGSELRDNLQKTISPNANKIPKEFRDFLDTIQSGVLNLSHKNSSWREYYDSLTKKLNMLGKMMFLENSKGVGSIGKEDKSKMLVLFSDDFRNLMSLVEITKAFAVFRNLLAKIDPQNCPFYYVIPTNSYYNSFLYEAPSSQLLVKHSLCIYNSYNENCTNPFSQLVESLPTKINFKLTKTTFSKKLLSEDLYIHLAYERSHDKNWCVACWTDQWGRTKKVKTWYCYPHKSQANSTGTSPGTNGTGISSKDGRKTFDQVAKEMGSETLSIAKAHSGKIYLVLTRLDGMISDNELAYWKKLSQGSDLSIIILSVDPNTRLTLSGAKFDFPFSKLSYKSAHANLYDTSRPDGLSGAGSSSTNNLRSISGMNESPSGSNSYSTPLFPESPEFYATNMTPGKTPVGHELFDDHVLDDRELKNYTLASLENGEVGKHDVKMFDPEQEFYGVVLKNGASLISFSNRFTSKTGYLIKPLKNTDQERLLTFEVNLVSHSQSLDSTAVLKEVLVQFRNLVQFNHILGNDSDKILSRTGEINIPSDLKNYNNDSVVPWHICTVKRLLSVLSHLKVGQ